MTTTLIKKVLIVRHKAFNTYKWSNEARKMLSVSHYKLRTVSIAASLFKIEDVVVSTGPCHIY